MFAGIDGNQVFSFQESSGGKGWLFDERDSGITRFNALRPASGSTAEMLQPLKN
jgi:hypothetical protein